MDATQPPPTLASRLVPVAAFLLVLLAYAWSFRAENALSVSPQPGRGYYPLLTEAFLSGQFSLKLAPDPRLATLKDPWAGYQGITRLHDASYYHGKYYIYFGAAPVVLVFIPVKLVTGGYASEAAAGLVFSLAAFVFGLFNLRMLLRAAKARPGPWLLAGMILAWGFGRHSLTLAQTPSFYAVPILCAEACLMAGLACCGLALQSERPGRASLWLGLASAAWGFAVGSRPHYVLSLPLLLIPWAMLLRRFGFRASFGQLTAAVVAPAGVIGAAIAYYNFARFGSIIEFGFHYQFTGSGNRDLTMWNPHDFLPNLRRYLVNDSLLFDTFPYLVPLTNMVGILRWMPAVGFAVFFPLSLLVGPLRKEPRWVSLGILALGAGLIHLSALCVLPVGDERYTSDFVPGLLLCALATAALVANGKGPFGSLMRIAVSILLAWTLTAEGMFVVERSPDGDTRGRIAAICDQVSALIEPLMGATYGPLQFDFTLGPTTSGPDEILLATGAGRDVVLFHRTDPTHSQLEFVHLGMPAIKGPVFESAPSSLHTLRIDLGSLYPAPEHPFYRGWPSDLGRLLRHRVFLDVDGIRYLRAQSDFYPSDAFHLSVGHSTPRGLHAVAFTGTLSQVRHLPPPSREELQAEGWKGPARLTVHFPSFAAAHTEPLVSAGVPGAGELLYVTYLSPTSFRLGLDANNAGAVESDPIMYDPAKAHTIDVSLGSLNQANGAYADDDIRFDGQPALHALRPTVHTEAYQVVFGYNACGSSGSQPAFSGELTPSAIPSFSGPALDTRLVGTGPIEASVVIAPMPAGVSEPLIVSGQAGQGDLIFVSFLPESQISFGIDHWSVGAVASAPMKLLIGHVYHVTVESATVLPPASSTLWGSVSAVERQRRLSVIRVFVDDRLVAEGPWPGYPSAPEHISIGANWIGGSSCTAHFSGTVVGVRRLPVSD